MSYGEDDTSVASIATIIIFTLLIVYIITGALIEVKKYIVGHETGICILLGFLVSLIMKIIVQDDAHSIQPFSFDSEIFFLITYPIFSLTI